MDEVILNRETETLLHRLSSHLPHALLLHEPKGFGANKIAQKLALQNGTILETVYPKKRQPSKEALVDLDNGSIIIEDIRALYERTRAKFTSPQIVIVDTAGRPMTHGAQNAFLKLLEEPQEQIHFIIVAQSLTHILPTVLSRCQKIDVLPIDKTQTEALLDKLSISDPVKRARIAFIATGLPAEITHLAEDSDYYEARVKIVQDARAALEGDSYARLRIAHSYKDNRINSLQLIDDMSRQLQLTILKNPAQDNLDQLDAFADAYDRILANGNIQLNLAKVLL